MQINNQPTSRQEHRPDGFLELHHMFPTIQGEGPFAGTPAIFVRLHGCNLQCPFCDTDYTSQNQLLGANEILRRLIHLDHSLAGPIGLVVITGGEPFRQNIVPLVQWLLATDYRVQVETNGTGFLHDFPFDRATVVCSPKTGRINVDIAKHAHAFKYVVQAGYIDPADGLPISTLGQLTQHSVARPPVGSRAEIYVQPLDEQDAVKNRANTDAAVESCMRYGYRLCIQTHKLVNLE
jgi:organic radical activating enzyme